MQKIKAFLSSVPKWKLFLASGTTLILVSLLIFVAPILRRQAVIKLGSISGLTITADNQDSLGIFNDSRFTLKSDEDLSVKAIKDNLKIEPDVEVEVVEVSPRQFQIKPKEVLGANEVIKIKLSTGDRDYSWAFQTRNNFRVVRTLPSNKTTSVPVNSGIEITFSHDNYADINDNFTISPKVDGRFERHQRTTSFIPKKLDPGTLYTVTVKKGVKLNGSNDVLSEDTIFQFETATNQGFDSNRINFVKTAYEFSQKETPAIDLYANNIDSLQNIEVNVYKYPSLNKFTEDFQNKLSIPRWANTYYDNYSTSTNGLNKILEFTAPIQKANYSGYFLFPQTLAKGFYLVEAKNGTSQAQAFIQVTDVSAYFTVSGTQTLAWVNRVDTGSPIQSAKVNVLGQEYLTDKDGISLFTSPSSLVENPNKLITISNSGDSLVIPAANNNFNNYYSDYQADRRNTDKFWSYLYLDRPLYQPSDTVRFWGLLRDRDNLGSSQKLTISLTKNNSFDYNYEAITVIEKEYQTSSIGTFIGDFKLPNLSPGWYSLSIKVGKNTVVSSGLSVEKYTKPAYQITLNSSKNAIIAGEDIALSGKAAFFEGTPVGNVKLKLFGQSNSEVTTDNQGNFQISIPTVSNQEGESYQPQYRNFSVNPSAPEEGDINAGTTVAVFNSSIYLRAKSESSQDKAKVSINLNQIDLSKFEPYQYGDDVSFIGAPVQTQINGELIEYSWQKNEVGTYYDFINKTTSPKYEYIQLKNNLGQFTLTTDSQGHAIYEFPLVKDKYYELKLSATDSQNRIANSQTFVYSSNLYSSPQDTRLVLNEDKTLNPGTYLIDEPVSLTPNQGSQPLTSGKMLYIFAQRGIKNYSLTNTSKFTFSFKENYVPNIFVQAIQFTGSTYQVSESLDLRFDNSSKKISLGLKLDKLTYLPGEKAHLTVTAKDKNGNPLSSEVNINLVDEAIFQMSPVSTDPLSQIYRNIDSDIVSYYLSHQYPIETNAAEGGGCFLSGTKIILANGTTTNIESIKAGDKIKTRASVTNSTLVNATVSQLMTHTVGQYLLINGHLRVTPEHNLYINGRWLVAEDIKLGDSYLDQNNHYQKISSIESFFGKFTVYNLSVEKYHTFFADGFYVHNEKGRELFVDTAFFGSVNTGVTGEAGLDITLPDNLTSWRITGQSITQDLKAGAKTEKLIVKQPFFTDIVMSKEYLISDQPILSFRSFGDQLNSNETVNYHVSIPSLQIEKDLSASALDSATISLTKLSVGTHPVTVSASAGDKKDKITRSFEVLSSRLSQNKSDYFTLNSETKITGSKDGQTTLVFSDQSTGKFFSLLSYLSHASGDRLDQKLSRVISREMIKQYFDSSIKQESFDPEPYHMQDGGYALLPYAESDIDTSLTMACLAKNKIDKSDLVNYFYNNLSAAKDYLTASQSLAGLACLDEPVLLLVDKFIALSDIDAQSLIYLTLAQAKLGDTEKSSSSLKSLMTQFGETADNLSYVKIGKTKDDYLSNTSILAVVASINNDNSSDKLYNYLVTNSAQDILLGDKQLMYIAAKISTVVPSTASFSYTLDGKKTTQELKQGGSYKMIVSPDQLSKLSFSDITGNVGMTASYEVPLTASQLSSDLSVNRNFSIPGKTTVEFVSTDLVKITINYTIKNTAQDGCYQLSDYLPSGLKVITRVYNRGIDTKVVSYPYSIDGQKVSFCVFKNDLQPVVYYARVASLGQFTAEPALMQSIISPSVFTLSNQSSVTIK